MPLKAVFEAVSVDEAVAEEEVDLEEDEAEEAEVEAEEAKKTRNGFL